ncbi:MAG: sulfotransferase [Anaerolineae bacterium]|nr:sulfotransferase [Anaerolineae bacterium]
MKPDYIFIVGLPRTGTKLMVDVVQSCREKRCYITPENFFLGRVLRPGVRHKMRRIGDMAVDDHVCEFVRKMYAGDYFGVYWWELVDGKIGIDQETMTQRLLATDRSDKAIYEQLLQAYAGDDRDGSIILGDKSGPHLYHVPTLMEWFPEAKIVHTLRDPRAILASELKKSQRLLQTSKKRKPSPYLVKLLKPFLSLIIILYITIAWLYAVKLHYKYSKRYPQNYYLSKFEDLVTNPEKSVRALCQFLEIEFHPAMLSPAQIDSSYAAGRESGFDSETLSRWKEHLNPWMSSWLIFWGKKYLQEFGYIH